MKVELPMTQSATFTSVMNLYHLFYTHNIKEALIDTKCKKHVDGVFSTIGNLQADFTTDSIDIDYLRGKDISMDVIHEFLLNSPLKSKAENFDEPLHFIASLRSYPWRLLFSECAP